MRILILALFLQVAFLNAQETVTHYSTQNGLPHDLTYELFQDKDGFIWIGTDDGVVKYDGQDFRTFNADDGLLSNYVIAINQMANGRIILGTWGGGIQSISGDKVDPLVSDDGSVFKINNLEVNGNKIYSRFGYRNIFFELDTLAGNYSYEYKELWNNRWIRRDKWLDTNVPVGAFTKIENKVYVHHENYIGEVGRYPTRQIKGIYLQEEEKLQTVFPFMKDKLITSLASYDKGFIASSKDSIFKFSGSKILSSERLNLPNQTVIKIIPYKNNTLLLLANDEKGIKYGYIFNMNTKEMVDLRKRENIKSTLSDILLDHENNIWLSTYGEGVFVLKNQGIKYSYVTSELLTRSNVKGITQKGDIIYVVTNDHVFLFQNRKLINTLRLSGFGKGVVKNANGDVVVSSIKMDADLIDHGYFLEKASFLFKDEPSYGEVLVADSLWIGDNAWLMEATMTIKDVTVYKDTLYVATNTGLSFFNKEKGEIQFEVKLNNKLHSNQVTAIQNQKDSILWIATDKGLHQVGEAIYEYFTENNRLVSNRINSLFLDAENKLWIGTQNGVSVLNGSNFFNITNETGLLSTYVSAIFEDDKSNVWIGGNKGLTIVENGQDIVSELPPLIHVIASNSKFEYRIISYNRSKVLKTQYRINKGDWISVSSSDVLDFSEYKPGGYKFQVRAKKEDSDWGFSKVYDFGITLPWYNSWWFIGMLLLGSVALIFFGAQARIRAVNKKNNTLKQIIDEKDALEKNLSMVRDTIAKDFHDDMGNKLARISLLSELLNKESEIETSRKHKLSQIATDANYLYKGTRDFIFSLKSDSDLLEEVIIYLSDFGEDYFSQFHISFKVNRAVAENMKLPYYWSRQLIFIFKEAMANIVRHANASKVVFSIGLNNKVLKMQIEDDGQGFSCDVMSYKNGLSNMQKRANLIKGNLLIHSEVGKGTTIKFEATLSK